MDLIQEYSGEEILRMKQCVCTRWYSTFYEFERFKGLRPSIVTFLNSPELRKDAETRDKCDAWVLALWHPTEGWNLIDKSFYGSHFSTLRDCQAESLCIARYVVVSVVVSVCVVVMTTAVVVMYVGIWIATEIQDYMDSDT